MYFEPPYSSVEDKTLLPSQANTMFFIFWMLCQRRYDMLAMVGGSFEYPIGIHEGDWTLEIIVFYCCWAERVERNMMVNSCLAFVSFWVSINRRSQIKFPLCFVPFQDKATCCMPHPHQLYNPLMDPFPKSNALTQ